MMLWINHEKQRYYRATVSCDLFGNLCVMRIWGSLFGDRCGSKVDVLDDESQLAACIDTIKKQRDKRQYHLIQK